MLDLKASHFEILRRKSAPQDDVAASFGLGGVPAFVANRAVATTGVQPLSQLRRLVEHARQG